MILQYCDPGQDHKPNAIQICMPSTAGDLLKLNWYFVGIEILLGMPSNSRYVLEVLFSGKLNLFDMSSTTSRLRKV